MTTTRSDVTMIRVDVERGRRAAELLHRAFATMGIHGRKDMPEDERPAGVERGSLGGAELGSSVPI